MAYIFQQVAKDAKRLKIDRKTTANAAEWYRNEAKKVIYVTNQKVLDNADPFTSFTASAVNAGKMYCFFYDAKTKEKLPYWDQFPLIFMVGTWESGFYGINLHYLPPQARAKLMDQLYAGHTNNLNFNRTMQLNINDLKSISYLRNFKPCFKKYRYDHVKSKVIYINPEKWDFAMMLPMQRFQKATDQQVWNDTMKSI